MGEYLDYFLNVLGSFVFPYTIPKIQTVGWWARINVFVPSFKVFFALTFTMTLHDFLENSSKLNYLLSTIIRTFILAIPEYAVCIEGFYDLTGHIALPAQFYYKKMTENNVNNSCINS